MTAQTDPKQAVRIRSFWMAAGSYLVGYVVLFVSYLLGVIGPQPLEYLIVPFLLPNVAFYILFRTGINRRFKEPSLTAAQIVVATLVIMYIVYLAEHVRPLILMFYLILFLFGLLRLTTRQLLGIGCFALATYAGIIFLVIRLKGEHVNLRMEVLYGLVLGLGLVWFALVGGYISKIRDKLRQSLKTIQQMAIHDELTGVFNRRHLNELLETEKSRCTRSGEDFSICIPARRKSAGNALARRHSVVQSKTRRSQSCGKRGAGTGRLRHPAKPCWSRSTRGRQPAELNLP